MKTIIKTLLIFAVVSVTSCKKGGDPVPTEPEPRTASEFLNLSYDEQVKFSEEYLKIFLGKDYRYNGRHVSELDDNGLPNGKRSKDYMQEASTACEKGFIIHMPEEMGYGGGNVTVSLNSEWVEERGCEVSESPYSSTLVVRENSANDLPLIVNFPDINEWVNEGTHQSAFRVLAFPFLDTHPTGIELLKQDGEHWYIYSFSVI